MQKPAMTPGIRLILATSFIIVCLLVTIACAINQPYTGLTLAAQDKTVRVTGSIHPHIPLGAELLSIQSASNTAIPVTMDDLIEDPHFLGSYAAMQQLFVRQSQLHQVLTEQQTIQLGLRIKPDQPVTYYSLPVAASRPINSLPLVFWFQLTVSSLGFLLGCWIWALRPYDIAARIFALLNAMYPVFAFSAAIYSTRDLALDGQFLHALVIVNTGGALLYGSALVSLFLIYPRVLVRPGRLWLIPAFFVSWLVADSFYLLPAPSMGSDLPVTLQMLGAILLAFWQWRINHNDPRARAALRWLATCILVSCGLFVFLVQSIQLLGIETSLSQGYAFGFFLLVTVGIAVGLKRYRLFDLDQWAFGILFWLAGAIVLVVLDALLIMVLSPGVSFGVAVLVCGLIWLPIRAALQKQFFTKGKIREEDLFQAVLDISFATTEQARSQQWQHLLTQLFQPLEIRPFNQYPVSAPILHADGLAMLLPEVGDMPCLLVQYPRQGRGLFSIQDCHLVTQLIALIQRANDSRDAYDRGASEERGRIARDLHDDIGSRLLSGLYQQDITLTKQVIRQSIADMRTIISGMTGTGLELDVVVQSLQQEINQRLQESNLTLNWVSDIEDGTIQLNYQIYKNYSSILRELMSNLIKYAQATEVHIVVKYINGRLSTRINDNGCGFDPDAVVNTSHQGGHGLNNLKQRILVLNGQLDIQSSEGKQGTQVNLSIPLT
jgi:signal transduction histidine kinase